MPFNDVLGNMGTVPRPQNVILVPKENIAGIGGVTVIVIVKERPQVPAAG